jgi:DNA modification methylase
MMKTNHIYKGDALEVLRSMPDNSVDCCVTSPPYYGLRDYGVGGQIGLEETPHAYIDRLLEVFTEVRRVLKPCGTLWLNIADSYAGSGRGHGGINTKCRQPKASFATPAFNKPYKVDGCKPKDLIGIPWMLAFALRESGWYLRQEIIWHKPNPMPESVRDRCTKSHESMFLLSKSSRYYFDSAAIAEPAKYPNDNRGARGDNRRNTIMNSVSGKTGQTRNKRDVWSIQTKPFRGAHFATFPPELVKPCILAGCPEGGIVLDPFFGAGTTGLVAQELDRRYVGIDLNPDYCRIALERLSNGVQTVDNEAA